MAQTLSREFLKKIAHAMQDEEIDVYTLSLYCMNTDDLSYFDAADREEVKRVFETLITDTKRHSELLKLIVELGEA